MKENSKDIFVYENFSSKIKWIYLWVFSIVFGAILLTYFITKIEAVLYVIPIGFVMGFIFYYLIPMSGAGEYSSIVVNNKSRVLKFMKRDGSEIVFNYDDITAIDYNVVSEPMARRAIISVNIFLKNGERKSISFSNLEFGINFLKKLPEDVMVMDSESSQLLQVIIVFSVSIVVFMIAMSIIFSIK